MARRPSPYPTIKLTTTLPQDIHARLSLHLYSDLEGCIPPGSYQRFFSSRVREFFESRQLDLSPYLGSLPGEVVVTGSPSSIDRLINLLKGDSSGARPYYPNQDS